MDYSKNERIAGEASVRRGRRVSKGGGSTEAFATGEVMCVSCGDQVLAATTIVTGKGPICGHCDLMENVPSASKSLWWQAGLSVALVFGAWLALAGLCWAMWTYGLPEPSSASTYAIHGSADSGGPYGFVMVSGALSAIGAATGFPLFRTARVDPEVSGVSEKARLPLGFIGLGTMVAGSVAFIASVVGFALL